LYLGEDSRVRRQSVVAMGWRGVKLSGDGCSARTPDLLGGVADVLVPHLLVTRVDSDKLRQ
jgi:hypothetical protein